MAAQGSYRLVFIEWEDAHAWHGWNEVEDLDDEASRCQSVGWLVYDGDNVKVVAPHLSKATKPPQGNGIMTIPSRAVITLVDLPDLEGVISSSALVCQEPES